MEELTIPEGEDSVVLSLSSDFTMAAVQVENVTDEGGTIYLHTLKKINIV